jgi:hypothetical protein
MDPVGVVVVRAGSTAVGAGAAGAVLVGEEPERNDEHTGHVWGWRKGMNSCGDMVDQIPAESMGRRHGTLRSAPL